MAEKNILEGGIKELELVCDALDERDNLQSELEEIIVKTGGLEGEVAVAEKEMQAVIQNTINKRLADVSANFDKDIDAEKGKMRAAKSRRDKAKKQGVKTRIEKETCELVKRNTEIKNEINTIFKSKGIPRFCNSGFYYAMYCTRTWKDWIVFAVTTLVCLAAIPGLFDILLNCFWLWKILLHVGIVVLFLAIYITIWLSTKDRFKTTIVGMCDKRDEMAVNRRVIRKTKKSIKKDKDDSKYDLHAYDLEMEEIEKHINTIIANKKQALEEFDKNTKPVITKEISDRSKEQIENRKKQISELTDRKRDIEDKQKEVLYRIATDYEAFLGNENMSQKRLMELREVMERGDAENIGEAVQYFVDNISE